MVLHLKGSMTVNNPLSAKAFDTTFAFCFKRRVQNSDLKYRVKALLHLEAAIILWFFLLSAKFFCSLQLEDFSLFCT